MAGVDVTGTLFVRDADEQLIAELRNPSGQISSVGLAAGLYRLTLEHQATYSLERSW